MPVMSRARRTGTGASVPYSGRWTRSPRKRFLPTRIHGVIDYLVAALLIVSPWLFGFAEGGAQQWVPVMLGAGALLYSLLTDYERGITKVFSMSAHLMLDLGSGVILAASPWIFGFSDELKWLHVVIGLGEIVAALTTKRYSDRSDEASVGTRSGYGELAR